MKKIIAIISVIVLGLPGYTQIRAYYVLSSTGDFSSAPQGSLSYTVGEMALVKTFSAGGHIITQGFQQGSWTAPAGGGGGVGLPVTLVDFTGYHSEGINHLKWETATEIDNDGFDVERLNSKGDYELIGFIKGAGNSATRHDYSLDDLHPLMGENYYRLKQKDTDGKTAYSKIISLHAGENAGLGLSIYPNPSTDHFNIVVYYDQSSSATITIADILGTVIYDGPLDIEAGVTHARMDLSSYAAGQYFVRLTTGATTETIRISKQ